MSERISYWPVRHGGTEQGRNHTKESLVVFGSGQAGWVDELTILHETNQTYCRSLKKVKFPTDQFRPALGSGCRLIVNHAQKTSKLPYFRLFRPIPKYFLPLLPYTDLVPPSTDPLPPSTNQYRLLLTQYHQVPTCTAFY